MGEIHMKFEPDGIRMWYTERRGRGGRVVVKGLAVKLATKADIKEDLPIFQYAANRGLSSGDSNDHNTG